MDTEDNASAWKAKLEPLRGARWPIAYRRRFNADELAVLRRGFWPQDMDDSWVIWLEGATLRAWRSWTCTCVYEVLLAPNDDGTAESQVVHVLDESADYHRHQLDAGELDRLEGVLGISLRQDRAATCSAW